MFNPQHWWADKKAQLYASWSRYMSNLSTLMILIGVIIMATLAIPVTLAHIGLFLLAAILLFLSPVRAHHEGIKYYKGD